MNELMTGAGQLSPSVMKVLEHSCLTSQLPPHHPHANSEPILTAMHSEHPLAKSRQSYSVTVCVWGEQKYRKHYYYLLQSGNVNPNG